MVEAADLKPEIAPGVPTAATWFGSPSIRKPGAKGWPPFRARCFLQAPTTPRRAVSHVPHYQPAKRLPVRGSLAGGPEERQAAFIGFVRADVLTAVLNRIGPLLGF